MYKRFLTVLMISAMAVLIGCGNSDLGTMPNQDVVDSATLNDSQLFVDDPDDGVIVEKWNLARECIEYSVTAWGHSCDPLQPRKIAKDRAIDKAAAKILELYNIEIASRVHTVPADALNRAEKVRHYGTLLCEDEGFSFNGVGVWAGYDVEVLETKDGADCGKDVKVRLTGDACIICYTP